MLLKAKLGRNRYRDDVLARHTNAEKSNTVYHRGGIVAAVNNQLTTMVVGPSYREKLDGKQILLLDNFLTYGSTTETGRNLLLAAGAKSVKVACIGKYGKSMYTVGVPGTLDPFGGKPPDAATFKYLHRGGLVDEGALSDFAASHAAMSKERW